MFLQYEKVHKDDIWEVHHTKKIAVKLLMDILNVRIIQMYRTNYTYKNAGANITTCRKL